MFKIFSFFLFIHHLIWIRETERHTNRTFKNETVIALREQYVSLAIAQKSTFLMPSNVHNGKIKHPYI